MWGPLWRAPHPAKSSRSPRKASLSPSWVPVRMSTYAQLRELGLERPAMADLDAYQMPSKNLPDGRGIVGKLDD